MSEKDESYTSINITLPKIPKWNSKNVYDVDVTTDYTSFEEMDEALNKARRALFILNERINEYERKEKIARKEYERNYKRYYLDSTEKTEAAKKARAEIKCEELENVFISYEQIRIELVRMSYMMKDEINMLQTIAHNLRAQLR